MIQSIFNKPLLTQPQVPSTPDLSELTALVKTVQEQTDILHDRVNDLQNTIDLKLNKDELNEKVKAILNELYPPVPVWIPMGPHLKKLISACAKIEEFHSWSDLEKVNKRVFMTSMNKMRGEFEKALGDTPYEEFKDWIQTKLGGNKAK